MAVTGCILLLIGAICPLILFRMLAFVDPGTSSGAAMRQSLAANGGVAGLLGGKTGGESGSSATAGSGAATNQDGQGRSQGESSADSATQSRFSSMLGGAGQVTQRGANALNSMGSKAASIGADVLGSAGVGHQAPYFGQGDISSGGTGVSAGQTTSSQTVASSRSGGTNDGQPPDPGGGVGRSEPHTPPVSQPPMPPTPGGSPSVPGMPNGGGAGGAGAAGEAGAATEIPVVPV
jgi:type IV secretion system protein TrbL